MVFVSIRRPNQRSVSKCLERVPQGAFNYDSKYVGATRKELSSVNDMTLRAEGYVKDHTRVRVGSGKNAYTRCKDLVKKWGHFQLGWTFVDSGTPLKTDEKVCVCGKALFLWTLNPLQILYVDEGTRGSALNLLPTRKGQIADSSTSRKAHSLDATSATKLEDDKFAFGHGTLKGHFLAGEERFSVEWKKEDDSVWYEIMAISKPAHFLSVISYPLARYLQKRFAKQSVRRVRQQLQSLDNVEAKELS